MLRWIILLMGRTEDVIKYLSEKEICVGQEDNCMQKKMSELLQKGHVWTACQKEGGRMLRTHSVYGVSECLDMNISFVKGTL